MFYLLFETGEEKMKCPYVPVNEIPVYCYRIVEAHLRAGRLPCEKGDIYCKYKGKLVFE